MPSGATTSLHQEKALVLKGWCAHRIFSFWLSRSKTTIGCHAGCPSRTDSRRLHHVVNTSNRTRRHAPNHTDHDAQHCITLFPTRRLHHVELHVCMSADIGIICVQMQCGQAPSGGGHGQPHVCYPSRDMVDRHHAHKYVPNPSGFPTLPPRSSSCRCEEENVR